MQQRPSGFRSFPSFLSAFIACAMPIFLNAWHVAGMRVVSGMIGALEHGTAGLNAISL